MSKLLAIAAVALLQNHPAVAAGSFAAVRDHAFLQSRSSQPSRGANLSIRAIPATSTSGAKILLAWNASANATSYNVYRSTASGAEGSTPVASSVTTTTYTDTGLANSTAYYYQVTAVNAYGESAKSNEVSTTTLPALPSAPSNLTATAGNVSASLTWTASTGANSYNVYQGTSAGGEAATPVASAITGTTYTATGLTNGTTYYFEVKAVNQGGTSAASNEASATPEAAVSYAAGLQFISSPLDYSSTALDAVFGYTGVKLAVWNPTSFSYALSPTAPADHLRLGAGYWVRLPQSVTLSGNGTPADTTKNFSIALSQGWNQIGDPFYTSVPISSLLVNGAAFAQASTGTQPTVSSALWAYDRSANGGSGGYAAAQSLNPQAGCWIYAYSNCTLQVPHPN